MSVPGRGGTSRQRAWLRALLTLPFAIVALALAPASAAGAALGWSSAVALDNSGGSAQLSSISCPTSTQCTALDGIGQEATFNPQAPGGFSVHSVEVGAELAAIACPSSTECVAIDGGQQSSHVGHELTFNPSNPADPAPHAIDAKPLVGLACPGAGQCVAIDDAGSEVAFNPQNLTTPAPTPVKLNANASSPALNAIACSSVSECTAIDANGYFYTFNPSTLASTPTATGQLSNETLPPIVAVSCPAALTCVALEGTVGGATEIDFNPTVSTSIASHPLEANNEPLGISCPSAAECIAIDSTGGGASTALIFDPSKGAATLKPIQAVSAIACPPATTTQCTAVGSGGAEQTFDPAEFATPAPHVVDPGNALGWVACAAASQCTAIDGRGREYTFDPDPSYLGRRTSHQVTTAQAALSFVACPAVDQCTGISGTTEETFDPQLPGTPSAQFFATATISGFACPLRSECVAIGDNSAGVEQGVTAFNPAHAGNASTNPIDNSLGEPSGLTCPTSTQCTTVAGGDEYTFAPADRPWQLTATAPQPITTGTESYTAVSCPSVTQCTAIANVPATGGEAVTFNPKSPAAVSPATIDADNSMTSISCPTTSVCVIVDSAGNVLELDPTQLAAVFSEPIGGAGPLDSVYCASATQCVAVDANGRMFYSGRGGAPPAVIHPPKPKPKPEPPTIAGASLSIGSHGKAKLRFTLHAGAHAPRIRSFTVTVSRGFSLKGSDNGVHVTGKVRLVHGKLVVTLKRAAEKVKLTVGAPPLRAPAHTRRLTVKVAVTDTAGKKTTISHKFDVQRKARAGAAANAAPELSTFGYGNDRTGTAPAGAGISPASASRLHVAWKTQTGGALDGQPLVLRNVRVANRVRDVTIVATSAGEVLALDAKRGVVLWRARVGSRKIEPNCVSSTNDRFGVFGTPVADPAAGLVYVVDETGRAWALELATGHVAAGWPVRVFPEGADFEWSALTLSRGRLYVPIASMCDTGHYYGGVTAVVVKHPSEVAHWLTSSGPDEYGGGVWGWGGVSVDARTGDVYAANANSLGKNSEDYGDGEHIVVFSPGLVPLQANDPLKAPFATVDRDFGTTPVLIDAPDCPAQLVAINKDGELFLYNRNGIGGGPVQRITVANITPTSIPLYGVPAYDAATRTLVLVSPTSPPGGALPAGVQAFTLTHGCRLTPKWQAHFDFPNAGSAPVIADGVVYIGSGRDGQLFAYRLSNGHELSRHKLSTNAIFAAPAVDDHTVYVGDWNGWLMALRAK